MTDSILPCCKRRRRSSRSRTKTLHGATAQSMPSDTGAGAVVRTSSSSAPVPRTGPNRAQSPTDLDAVAVAQEIAWLYAREGRWPDETSARSYLRFAGQRTVTLHTADRIIVGAFGRPDVLLWLIDSATIGTAA